MDNQWAYNIWCSVLVMTKYTAETKDLVFPVIYEGHRFEVGRNWSLRTYNVALLEDATVVAEVRVTDKELRPNKPVWPIALEKLNA